MSEIDQNYYWHTAESDYDLGSDPFIIEQREIIARQTEEADAVLEAAFTEGSDVILRYQRLLEYGAARDKIRIEEIKNDSNHLSGALKTFELLADLETQTDSYYTRRLITWLKNKEVHNVTGYAYKTDAWPDDGAYPKNAEWQLTAETTDWLRDHPAYAGLFEYGRELKSEYPQLGDDDYYAPDPFIELRKKGGIKGSGETDGIYELAIETSALFGVRPANLTKEAKAGLATFGISLTQDQYTKIQSTFERTKGSSNRVAAAEAFLATEFDAKWVDTLLKIMDAAGEEGSCEVFDIINNYRASSRKFADWFNAFDTDFAASAAWAMNERLTDTLAIAEKVMVEGSAIVPIGVGGTYSAGSMDKVLEDMQLLHKTLNIITTVVPDNDTTVARINEPNQQFSIYRFSHAEKGEVLLYVREAGAKAYDRQFEYGGRKGVEASISFVANPLNPQRLRSDKDPDGVSFRFDREGRALGEDPFSDERDPTRSDGLISIDVSSIFGNAESASARTGRCVAAGNVLRAQRNGQRESLHHNTNYFDQSHYGTSEGFESLAHYVKQMAEVRLGENTTQTRLARLATRAVVGQGQRSAA